MASVSETISRLRTLIKQYSDDSPFTDEFLYSVLNSGKARLLRQRATSFNKLPNAQCFCIELVKATSHDCACIDIGCEVLMTKYPIPDTIFGRNTELLYLKTLGEQEIPIIDFRELSYMNLDPIKANKRVATEYNRHFLIWNEEDLEALIVCAIWSDIAAWSDIQLCPDSDNPGDCFNLDTTEFNLPKDMEITLYEFAMRELNIPMQLKEDMTNDSNENIKY